MHTIETPFGEPGYLVLSGSRLYGIDTTKSDYDYAGALVEPEAYRVGLKTYSQGKHDQHGFEQHVFEGDNYEGTIYSLWKLVSMFADGNPTVLCYMFATPVRDDFGINTEGFRKAVASKRSGHRFLRYMESQRKSMLSQRSKHVTRTALVAAHGYDTKFAGHVIRLGYQGIEFLNTGKITLPMRDPERQFVVAVRNGEWPMSDVLMLAAELEAKMHTALADSPLPETPDYEALSQWVVMKYQNTWHHRIIEKFIEERQETS